MKTKDITLGAMCTAIYALLLLFNQQTALAVEGAAPWLFVFPALVYAAKTGVRPALCAGLAMILVTFLFGGFTTWFYSVTSIVTGVITGILIHRGVSGGIRLLVLFLLQFLSNLAILLLWAGLFDLDYSADFQMVHSMIPWLDFSVFLFLVDGILSIMTAICIHVCAQALLLRMKIPCPPFTPVTQIVPHKLPALLFLLFLLLFLFFPPVVIYGIESRNLFLLLLLPFFVWMDWYGTVFLMNRCVIRGRRSWVPAATAGALVPGLNFFWAGLGTAYALRSERL